jgi:tetratricopeptide (TPR) repeat protein
MKKSLIAIFFISNISFCQTVEEYFNSANEKAKIKNLSGAIEDYNKAIELNPNFAVAYFNRGFIKAKQNNFIDAVEDYSKYISLKPNSPKAYSIRAFAYARINKNKEAIQDYSTYIEYLPEDNDVINSRGLLRQTIGDFKVL